jgi:hypothetical protein
MKYDPERHHRRSIRLRHWDYAGAGAYFFTICVENRECVLGKIVNSQAQLNALGNLGAEGLQNLPLRFPNVALDGFVVMPNHVQFIVWLNPPPDTRAGVPNVGAPNVGTQFNCAPTTIAPTPDGATGTPTPGTSTPGASTDSPIGISIRVDKERPTLGQVIRALKAATARRIHQSGGDGFVWQRNYYGHIIRDEDELYRIRQYMLDNPANWSTDGENPNPQNKPVSQ